MMFHTLLSSTVLQTNSMSKLRINVDGWMKPNPEYLQSMRVVILFVIHLDLLPSSIRTQSLHSVVDYERCSPGKDGEIGSQTGRQTDDRQTDRGLKEKQPSSGPCTAPIQIYYLCSRSGHFTAVFTLDPAVSIRWQCPGLQMWLPIHRPTTSQSANPTPNPNPFFNMSSDTINQILKKSQQPVSSRT